MPPIDWNNLILLPEWAEALQQLLAAAAHAAQRNGSERQQVAELLRTFVKKSPVDAGTLDDIATRAIIDLNSSVIAEAVQAIQDRSAELKQQLALLTGVASQARTDAKSLRFEGVNKVLADAKVALKALQRANNALSSPDTALTKKIAAIVKAIDELG